jgi:hypothetical protein
MFPSPLKNDKRVYKLFKNRFTEGDNNNNILLGHLLV